MKKNLIRSPVIAAVFISMFGILLAQNPVPPSTPVPPAPSPYPPAPNQVPQDPTIPKLSIPLNAPTDSVFRKLDNDEKPFRLRGNDTAAVPFPDTSRTPEN